eukprot:764344-Hanusia_phi.AAC.1
MGYDRKVSKPDSTTPPCEGQLEYPTRMPSAQLLSLLVRAGRENRRRRGGGAKQHVRKSTEKQRDSKLK